MSVVVFCFYTMSPSVLQVHHAMLDQVRSSNGAYKALESFELHVCTQTLKQHMRLTKRSFRHGMEDRQPLIPPGSEVAFEMPVRMPAEGDLKDLRAKQAGMRQQVREARGLCALC